ncbi:hypothetical protein C9I57_09990 [Trinickia symbiotica]|uniref:Uncharacterized protein n=1 Tax=Trinickia symbiotica TaxID=863227 RepID=A0A2T3XX23_9BURK|nr:hypothetical protein [Trinickia symbiotica]PTB21042.1 hypothetical protein C9I57_09990 [Trinickia symbiotica]
MSKIDTRVRNVTERGANLFAELSFAPEESRPYQAESQALINETLPRKKPLKGERSPLGSEHQHPMDRASRTDWEWLKKLKDEQIDTSDIPELSDEFFARACILAPQYR